MAAQRQFYTRVRAKGLCGRCYKKPAVPGRTMCKPCLAGRRAYMARRRQDSSFRKAAREKEATRRRAEKVAAFEAYGGFRCSCCGVTDEVFLTLDHIEEVGKNAPDRSGYPLYHRLKLEGYPAGFRVLCRNCNWATHRGVCPHQ